MADSTKDRWKEFNSIVDKLDLEAKEKLLLIVLFRHVNYITDYANPSRELLKQKTGINQDKTLNKYMNSLIEKGYIVRNSGKGIRSKYFIKVEVENTPSVKNAPSGENTPIVEVKNTPIVEVKNTPQKEKEKKIKENIIYSHWNSKKIIVHKSLTKDIDKAIEKALKKYSEEEIVQAIDIYAEILQSDFYFNYRWSLADFLNRKNGIDTFMEEGSNKANYNQWKNKKSNNSGDDKPTKLLGWD